MLSSRRSFFSAKRGLWRRVAVFLLIVVLPLYAIYNFQLYPGISHLAKAAASNRIEGVMAAAFAATLAEDEDAFEDLVSISLRADGGVASVTCHVPRLNATRNRLLLAVLSSLSTQESVEVGLPIGNLLGGEAFSGRGPEIPIRILLASGAHAHMESDLREAGINQTLYRVLFSVTVELTILTPSRPIETTLTQTYCVAETLIVGEVPDALTQINRLTEEISEEEIDDVNDFGAKL
jgi:sporulation protein YunB